VLRCTAHPTEVSGWHCPLCARELCVACAAPTEHGVVVCAACGTLATVQLAPRGEVFPFLQVWPEAVREVGSRAGIVQVLIAGSAAHALFTVGKWLWIAGCLLTVAWVLNVARRAAAGIGAFGVPTWEDFRLVAAGALPRFVCATGLIGVGAMAWTRLGLVAGPLDSPWPWALALAALIAVPPALVIASVEGQDSRIVWPWQLRRWLRALGPELRPLQGAVLAAAALGLLLSWIPPINRELEDPEMIVRLFESWIPRALSFAALGALGSLAGLLVFTRASALGHRVRDNDQVPRVNALPTGRFVPAARDLEAEAQERARKFVPIALEDFSPESAIDRGEREAAIAGYRSGEVRVAQLGLEAAVTLAQWLAGSGDFLAAANVLRVVTARVGGDDVALAKALVVLARLCAERLDAQSEALRLYEEVERRFPGSAAARFASEQLSARR
jgi:hypothetical protein